MADRRPKLRFDAIAAIQAARSFVASVTLEQYEADLMRRSGTERQLEILGEACSRLAREAQAEFELIRGARLAVGLRNRIIHGCDAVDDETVYRTVRDDLPGLEMALRSWLERIAPPA